jgi:PKD repeat protein/glucose/arabinose dehydrogenase
MVGTELRSILMTMRGMRVASMVLSCLLMAMVSSVVAIPPDGAGAAVPPGFEMTEVMSGLERPTAMEIAPDGSVFVTEKRGRLVRYDSLSDTTPTVVADRRTQTHNRGDRGMLGLAVHPNYPVTPYVYVSYALDRLPSGGPIPAYGEVGGNSDPCPNSATTGCPILSRVVRFNGTVAGSGETVLFEGHCQQFQNHTVGDLVFESENSLLVSFGDGSTGSFVEYGQRSNLCGDPPGAVGTDLSSPTTEGGQARSQDILTRSDPTGVHGSVLRVNPNTFDARPENPMSGDAEANVARMIATGFRNPFRMAVDPQSGRIFVGNVGGAGADEINMFNRTGDLYNSGWPCYEGPGTTQNTFWLTTNICNTLIASGDHDAPLFSYGRNAPITAGEPCPTGGLSIGGLAVNRAGFGPASLDGALFFSDYTRDCIWYLPAGGNGTPNPAAPTLFASGVGGIVDLSFGPDGALYGLAILGERVLRFAETGDNSTPTARFTASVTGGAPPLAVSFDGSTSTDPDVGDTLTYAWDFDGNGSTDATGVSASHTYNTAGTYNARLTVTDQGGLSNSTTRTITVASGTIAIVVTEPATGRTFKTGALVPVRATATYADGRPVDSSAFSWTLNIEHCVPNAPDSCHSHDLTSLVGNRRVFVMPDHEYPSFVEARLTVDPGDAAPASVVVPVNFRLVDLDVQTLPAGLDVLVGSAAETAPFTRELAMAATTSLSAAVSQTVDGVQYDFVEWRLNGVRLSTQRFAELNLEQDGAVVAVYSADGGVPDVERPSTPRGLTTTALTSSIRLNWTASTDNVGIAEYEVYRSTDGSFGTLVSTSTSTSFTDGNVSQGVDYTYAVKAVDGAGNRSWRSNLSTEAISNGGGLDTERPTTPRGLKATRINAGVNLTWTASTDNVGVVRYQIYRSADGTLGPLFATTTNTSFVNESVALGETYTYAIRAEDAAGNVSWRSNLASITVD